MVWWHSRILPSTHQPVQCHTDYYMPVDDGKQRAIADSIDNNNINNIN